MKNEVLKHNKLLILSLFFLLTVDTGLYSLLKIKGSIRIAILVAAVGVLVLVKFQKVIFSRDFSTRFKRSFGFFVFSLILPVVHGKYDIKQMIIFLVAMTVGYLLTLFVSYEDFKEVFLFLIRLLSIYSLITFVIGIVFSDEFLMRFLTFFEFRDSVFLNFVFSVFNISMGFPRNYGVFWEPGAFAIFLCVALYIELFERKFDVKRILLLIITMLSTSSTLGIICMVMLLAAFVLTDNNYISFRFKAIVIAGCIFALLFTIIYGQSFLHQVFSKLDMSGQSINGSTSVRINAIIYPGLAFLENPAFGVGYDEYFIIQERFCQDMATCTFVNWLCLFGVIGGIFPIIGAIRYFVVNEHTFFTKCILFVFALCLFSTENCIIINFMYMLVFYGFQKRRRTSFLSRVF